MDSNLQDDIKCEIKVENEGVVEEPKVVYYKCDQCPFMCVQHQKLNDHKKFTHPIIDDSTVILNFDEQINELSKLSKTFSEDNSSQQLEYVCNFCGKVFPKVFRLKRHIMTVHTDYRPFGCDLCDKRFKEKSHLKTHCKNVHKFIAPTVVVSNSSQQPSSVSKSTVPQGSLSLLNVVCNPPPMNAIINPSGGGDDADNDNSCQTAIIQSNSLSAPSSSSNNEMTPHKRTNNGDPSCSDFFKFSNRWKRCLKFCEKCHVEFEKDSAFVQHWRLCCRICHFETVDQAALIKHSRAHSFNFPVSCGKCGLFLKTFSRLKLHQSYNHSNIFPYKCNRCPLNFQYRSHLLKHKHSTYRIYTEHAGGAFNCNLLEDSALFDSNSMDLSSSNSTVEQSLASIINQNRLYHGNDDGTDPESSSNQILNLNFEDHEVIYKQHECRKNHRGRFLGFPRTILCDYCRKPFCSQEEVNRHKFVAPPDRPYKCNQCCKSFKKKGHLTDHMRVHGEASLYHCDFCDKSFKRRAQLVSHIHYTHKNTRRLSCPHCGKVTKSTHGYKAHLLSHTNQRPEVCEICGRTFKSKMHLRSHILSHGENFPFKCELCDMGFRERHRLNRHMLIHGGDARPFQCDKCEKSFTVESLLLSHLLSHNQATTHTCEYCNKSFAFRKYLVRHLQFIHGIDQSLKPLIPM